MTIICPDCNSEDVDVYEDDTAFCNDCGAFLQEDELEYLEDEDDE